MTIKDFASASARKKMKLHDFNLRTAEVSKAAEVYGSDQSQVLERLLPDIQDRYALKQWQDFTSVAEAYLSALQLSLSTDTPRVALPFETTFLPFQEAIHADDFELLKQYYDQAHGDYVAEIELAERSHEENGRFIIPQGVLDLSK